MDIDFIKQESKGVLLNVRIQPRSSRTGPIDIYKENNFSSLRWAVHEAPVDGEANQALCCNIAKILNLPKSKVSLVSGLKNRNKVILLEHADFTEIKARLTKLL